MYGSILLQIIYLRKVLLHVRKMKLSQSVQIGLVIANN